MAGLFDIFKRKKDESSPEYRRAFAKRLENKHIRYVSHREDDTDTVIGKDGYITINADNQLLLSCEGHVVFRADIDQLIMGELMSLEGVILEAFDYEAGKDRKVIAYYKYYR